MRLNPLAELQIADCRLQNQKPRSNGQSAISNRRLAYTLLEVLLASAIAVLLLGALYVAVNVQLRHAQTARDVVEQSTLARSVLTRMARDITASLGPTPPATPGTSSSASTVGGGSSSSATAGNTTSSGSGSSASSGSGTTTGSGSGSGSTTASANSSNAALINLGVQGDNSRLILSASRVPPILSQAMDATNANVPPVASDLRRITYWLAGGAGTPLGLARQELTLVTSDDAKSSIPPDIPDEAAYVIAEEVTNLTFQYWDGNTWQDQWDGTTPGADGVTPIGPPLAIAITIDVASRGGRASGFNPEARGAEVRIKTYRHIVAIPTANGATTPNTSGTTSGG